MSHRGQSVTQYIVEQQRQHPQAKGDLSGLINDIASACKAIAHRVSRSAIMGLAGHADSENSQGEQQKKLDIVSQDCLVSQLNWTGHLAGMVSEEAEDWIPIPDAFPKGRYLLCFDPLDGSSNVDNNFSVGTIFSVLRCPDGVETPQQTDFLQPGTEQVCAGFCVYGPATMLILTVGHGVQGFTLDRDVGEFILTHLDMRIPEQTNEFAINTSNQRYWQAPIQHYIAECVAGTTGTREKNFNMRWNASMVAEVYRILVRGGIFLYPIDSRINEQGGKLRLLYEANPMSFIVEQAGGISSTGTQRIMTLTPTSIHQRIPVILGSKQEVERVIRYHQSAH